MILSIVGNGKFHLQKFLDHGESGCEAINEVAILVKLRILNAIYIRLIIKIASVPKKVHIERGTGYFSWDLDVSQLGR